MKLGLSAVKTWAHCSPVDNTVPLLISGGMQMAANSPADTLAKIAEIKSVTFNLITWSRRLSSGCLCPNFN